eukprot:TRINITY_DN34159_c0_g1_i1.p1 TRINITY_DN34159_c0_g1~~TRINITY_DN34159_c0_g1_i1.p1  ORF type:complete len:383 (+),score=97.46 TRINITY_DN34159_c0_g1_i1:139-1287(+)
MGNQASIAQGSRSTSIHPPHIPSQAPLPTPSKRERRYSEQESRKISIGSVTTSGVPISGVRKLSGGNGTPGTYETPPCINVKSRQISMDGYPPGRTRTISSSDQDLDTAPQFLLISPTSEKEKEINLPKTNLQYSSPIVPLSQRFRLKKEEDDFETPIIRQRARTTNTVLRNESNRGRTKLVPTVFKYSKNPNADDVYMTGSMTSWKCVKMSKPEGESYWVSIQDTREGTIHYKFLVDGHWCVEDNVHKVKNEEGIEWNVMEVRKSDFEVFEALACDSFNLKNTEKAKEEKKFKSDSWCQVSPDFDKLDIKLKTPPTLPPHLLQVILNRDVSYLPDPILLEEPSHVMLNHLYAQAIRDGLLVLSTTQRFRKKYVTTLLYKPI